MLLVMKRAGGHIDLAADNRLDAGLSAGFIESHSSVHDAMIRHGKSGHVQLFRALSNLVDAAGTVEQGILGMDMEMDEAYGKPPVLGYRGQGIGDREYACGRRGDLRIQGSGDRE